MSPASQLEKRLFWLCIALKALFWIAILAVLIVALRDASAGHRIGPPMAMIWAIPILFGLQLLVWSIWYLVRRARFRRSEG